MTASETSPPRDTEHAIPPVHHRSARAAVVTGSFSAGMGMGDTGLRTAACFPEGNARVRFGWHSQWHTSGRIGGREGPGAPNRFRVGDGGHRMAGPAPGAPSGDYGDGEGGGRRDVNTLDLDRLDRLQTVHATGDRHCKSPLVNGPRYGRGGTIEPIGEASTLPPLHLRGLPLAPPARWRAVSLAQSSVGRAPDAGGDEPADRPTAARVPAVADALLQIAPDPRPQADRARAAADVREPGSLTV